MEQSHFWESDIYSGTKVFKTNLRNPKFHYRIHKWVAGPYVKANKAMKWFVRPTWCNNYDLSINHQVGLTKHFILRMHGHTNMKQSQYNKASTTSHSTHLRLVQWLLLQMENHGRTSNICLHCRSTCNFGERRFQGGFEVGTVVTRRLTKQHKGRHQQRMEKLVQLFDQRKGTGTAIQ